MYPQPALFKLCILGGIKAEEPWQKHIPPLTLHVEDQLVPVLKNGDVLGGEERQVDLQQVRAVLRREPVGLLLREEVRGISLLVERLAQFPQEVDAERLAAQVRQPKDRQPGERLLDLPQVAFLGVEVVSKQQA